MQREEGGKRGFKRHGGIKGFSVDASPAEPSGAAVEDAYRVLAEELLNRIEGRGRTPGEEGASPLPPA